MIVCGWMSRLVHAPGAIHDGDAFVTLSGSSQHVRRAVTPAKGLVSVCPNTEVHPHAPTTKNYLAGQAGSRKVWISIK